MAWVASINLWGINTVLLEWRRPLFSERLNLSLIGGVMASSSIGLKLSGGVCVGGMIGSGSSGLLEPLLDRMV